MNLKPQDVLVVLGGVCKSPTISSYQDRSIQLGLSVSEVHAADKRLHAAGLMAEGRPVIAALEEFLVHGLRYVFVPERGSVVRGIPTAHAGPGLSALFHVDELPPVWPSPEGTVRGLSFSPLYRSAPEAALRDIKLHELLALADALRGGRARERKLAAELIHQHLSDALYAA
ncbi:MAG: hypothetical protein U0998_11645 [Moraxellaceae bacterium]|nr:hypothetical protein [Moraxellaceae bacterium]MDZ4387824.1 hypothetical protein [Moraxellaceae bacterium]